MSTEKKTIILSLGPLHLFWTTGVYALYELSQEYNVVLIAWDSYERDSDFQHVVSKFDVTDIVYIPIGGSVRRNWFEARVFRGLSRKHNISLVLQHEHVFEDNLYLQFFLRRRQPQCKFVTYQNGMELVTDSAADFLARKALALTGFQSRYPKTPATLLKYLFFCRVWLLYLANYRIFPFLFAGAIFHPEVHINTGRRLKLAQNNQDRQYDYSLFYTSEELEAHKSRMGITTNKCIHVHHPIKMIGRECNLLIYGAENVNEEDFIVLFPSAGTVDTLLNSGISSEQVGVEVAKKWNQVIAVLRDVYPNYRIAWKLHPGAANNQFHIDIQDQVSDCNPFLEIIDPGSNAQKLILSARVIVSEVSTVLWWANFYTGKTALSLDLFDYKAGDEMKYRPGIKYCNNLLGLKEVLQRRQDVADEQEPLTVSAVLKSIGV